MLLFGEILYRHAMVIAVVSAGHNNLTGVAAAIVAGYIHRTSSVWWATQALGMTRCFFLDACGFNMASHAAFGWVLADLCWEDCKHVGIVLVMRVMRMVMHNCTASWAAFIGQSPSEGLQPAAAAAFGLCGHMESGLKQALRLAILNRGG